MNNKKSTKRTLMTSILSLVLCMAMLIGTTFAWFTDNVTSGNNKIVAGNLKVDLEVLEEDNTTWTSIKNEPKPIFNYEYWEPGYTEVKILKVVNEGTLALKWKAMLTSENVLSDLANVIDVYVKEGVTAYSTERAVLDDWTKVGTLASFVGTLETTTVGELEANASETLGLAFKMQESAGNEYQGMDLGGLFDICITATQLTSEEDSFDDQYDKDADYNGEISNATSLAAALKNGGTYKVVNDIVLDSAAIVPAGVTVTLDLNGKTITGNMVVSTGAALTVAGGSIVNNDSSVSAIETTGTLVLEDVNISSARHVVRVEGGNVTINGGTYAVDADSSKTLHALNVSDGGYVTINDGTFIGPKGTVADSGAAVNVQANSTVIINGGNFSKGKNNTLAAKGSLTVYGGSFDQDPTQYVAAGYKAVSFDGAYIVVLENTGVAESNDALDEVLKEGSTTIILGTGTYKMPASAKSKTLTISGTKNTIIEIIPSGQGEAGGQLDYNLDSSTVTFNDMTIKTNNKTYAGYARLSATYNNCTFENQYCLNGNSEFNNCTFNVSGDVYNIWTWGAPNATFNGCTFNSDGKALLLYGTVNTNLTVNDCVFNDNGGLTDLKAAIEIGNDYGTTYTLTVKNTVVNGYEINDKGISTGTTLWANKNSMGTDKLNVVVDGVDVY